MRISPAPFILVVGKDGEITVDQRQMLVMETLAESENSHYFREGSLHCNPWERERIHSGGTD